MLTVFTTFRCYGLPQKNAVQSWLALDHSIHIIIFSEQLDLEKIICNKRVAIISDFEKHPGGLPLLNHIFEKASHLCHHNTLCYVNSDIILLPELKDSFQALIKLKKPFLAVCERIDLDVIQEIDFGNLSSIEMLKRLALSRAKNHPPYGSDIFIFPRFQYSTENMPDLVVGRPGWDNWMIFDARKRFNKLIDLRLPNAVIHQDHESKYCSTRRDDQVNYPFLPKDDLYTFILSYCNFYIKKNSIKSFFYKPKNGQDIAAEIAVRLKWEKEFCKGKIRYLFYLFLLKYYLRIKNMLFKRLGSLNTY